MEMSRAICGSLAQGGFDASPLALSYSASAAEVKRKLAQAGSQITLLLTLHQWTYDGYWSTGITFGMTLAVLDREGNVLATAEQSGEETLNQSSPKFFAQKLALLMNDPGVAGALGAAP